MTENGVEEQQAHPTVADAISALRADDDAMNTPPDRIDIRVLGNGVVAYRVWPLGGGDYVGGVSLPPDA